MTDLALWPAGALLAGGWFVRRRWPWGRHPLARVAGRLFVLFGLSAIACLLLIGRAGAVSGMPAEFRAVQAMVAAWTGVAAPVDLPVSWMVLAMLAGGVIAGLVARWRGRPPSTLGDIRALTPRSPRDLAWGALVSLDAGLCEELYFRLALPLWIAVASGSAAAGFALSAGLFAWAHRYQGALGMAATLVVAALLTAAYLLTEQLWVAMVLHAALDVNGLVVRPVVAGTVRRG